jgi:hypothetical protein
MVGANEALQSREQLIVSDLMDVVRIGQRLCHAIPLTRHNKYNTQFSAPLQGAQCRDTRENENRSTRSLSSRFSVTTRLGEQF